MNKKYDYPETVVGVFIKNTTDEYFFVDSHNWKDTLTIPGGHIELGEKAVDAVIREVKEETNLDIADIKFIRYVEVIFDPSFSVDRHLLGLHFSCKALSSSVILNEEHKAGKWLTKQEILESPLISERVKTSFTLIS